MSTPTSQRISFEKELRFIRVHINEKPYWEYVTRVNSAQGVTIVAVTDSREIILVKQYRIPLGKFVIELPAGLVGDKNKNETPKEAVAKELLEETGYVVEPDNIRLLAKGPALAGLTDEINGLYLATDARKQGLGGGDKDEGEKIETLVVPLVNVMDELKRYEELGDVIDLKVHAGLHFLPDSQR
ncbi:MAG: NUDIX hydrolase [Proteobacteria bacterium]|nr:NUDIX hydrolase [Pseudomonadota bacterium]